MSRILSCFTNSYGRFGPEAALQWLPDAGLHYVELAIKTAGVPSFFKETPLLTNESTPAELERARRLVEDSGLELSSCNVTTGNPVDPVAVEVTIRKLDLAARLGATLVVAGAGDPGPHEVRRRTLWDHLRRIGDAAGERGITYCCETHPGVCQNADRMLETMDRVAHPHVRLNFDTGNLFFYNAGADLEVALQRVAPFVRHVHLKDTPGDFEKWHFTELGGGIIDFVLVREILDAAGYSGPYSLEIEGIAGEPEQTLEQHHARVKHSVEHLAQCGYLLPP